MRYKIIELYQIPVKQQQVFKHKPYNITCISIYAVSAQHWIVGPYLCINYHVACRCYHVININFANISIIDAMIAF